MATKSTGTAARKPSPTARKQEEKRRERMALIKQQVKDGTLVIRKMTAEEREKYPPRPVDPNRKRRRR